jgi:hypothetical protein
MAYKFNPFTGKLDEVGAGGGGGGTPGGSDTQIQFNDGGSFGGDADLTWNKTTNLLDINGDIQLDDGGTYTTTIQCVTPTVTNKTISFPDATGTVALVAGSSGQLTYNNAGAQAGLTSANIGSTGEINVSLAGAASTPPVTFTGSWFTGGTATTTKPQRLIEPAGTTSTAWSTSGTGIGVNAASGFAGNLLDLQVNGTSQFRLNNEGALTMPNDFIFTRGASVSLRAGVTYLGIASELRFSNNNASSGDVTLARDATDTLAQRRGTNAQTARIYDTYTSSTDYHRIAIATARATLTNVSGASVTATGLIPAGAVVMGVTSKVTTALGTTNGTTGYKIGTGADDDRWGAITGTVAGTTSDNRDWTAGTIECFPSTTDVIVTATGGNFDATGVIYLSVQYMAGEAD